MLPPQQTYPDLPVYIEDLQTRGYLTHRIEDQYVVRLTDGRWATVAKEHINTLH